MDFTPRFIQILFLLLNASKPITASELAEQLQINKRTIFRELDHVDSQLKQYGLILQRKSGVGYLLEGKEEDKKRLLAKLEVSDHFDPRNREKRHQKFIDSLLQTDSPQKLFYYANKLQVSEATLSKDLEIIEKWLEMHKIHVQKQGGVGVSLQYREADFRKGMLAYMAKYKDDSYVTQEMKAKIYLIAESTDSELMSWLTGSSEENFILYTAITVQRIQSGKSITQVLENRNIRNEGYYQFIENFAVLLEKEWDIVIGENDKYDLYIFLQGCRLQYAHGEEEVIFIDQRVIDMKNVVYEMANYFDPVLSYALKTDEEFVRGMIAHLMPTVTRLLHHISIKNPMLDQVKESYPDIYQKADRASKVMERILNVSVPEDEVGYLALHFGGAMMRIDQEKRQRHVVDVGVLCSNGIGMSMLLSSKMKHYFGERINIQTLGTKNVKHAEIDFLVSTIPIDAEAETIYVNPLLEEEDIQKISNLVEKYAFMEKRNLKNPKANDHVYEAMLITREINSIIKDFSFRTLEQDICFEDAVKEISGFFADDTDTAAVIYRDFTEREALSTQVIEEFGIVFLHAKTKAVSESKFMVVLPEGTSFQNTYFKESRAIIVMLIPEDDPRRRLAISAISEMIFEEEEFLEEIKTRQEDAVFRKIQESLENYLNEYLISTYGK